MFSCQSVSHTNTVTDLNLLKFSADSHDPDRMNHNELIFLTASDAHPVTRWSTITRSVQTIQQLFSSAAVHVCISTDQLVCL